MERVFGGRVFLVIALLLSITMWPREAGARGGHRLKPDAVEKEILRLADRVRRDVKDGKTDALLALVAPTGIVCRDSLIPRADVERDLKDPASLAYAILFDAKALESRHSDSGLTGSWRDMFRAHPDVAILVNFVEFPDQDPYAYPCVSYVADDDNSPAGLCFFRRDGRWWLRESLYQCD